MKLGVLTPNGRILKKAPALKIPRVEKPWFAGIRMSKYIDNIVGSQAATAPARSGEGDQERS